MISPTSPLSASDPISPAPPSIYSNLSPRLSLLLPSCAPQHPPCTAPKEAQVRRELRRAAGPDGISARLLRSCGPAVRWTTNYKSPTICEGLGLEVGHGCSTGAPNELRSSSTTCDLHKFSDSAIVKLITDDRELIRDLVESNRAASRLMQGQPKNCWCTNSLHHHR